MSAACGTTAHSMSSQATPSLRITTSCPAAWSAPAIARTWQLATFVTAESWPRMDNAIRMRAPYADLVLVPDAAGFSARQSLLLMSRSTERRSESRTKDGRGAMSGPLVLAGLAL